MGDTELYMSTSAGARVFPASFSSLGKIPWGPVALEIFNLLMFSSTVRSEMTIEDVLVVDKTGGTLRFVSSI